MRITSVVSTVYCSVGNSQLTRLAGRHRAPSRGGKPGPGRGTSGNSWFAVLQTCQDPELYNSAASPASPHVCDIWYLLLREENI